MKTVLTIAGYDPSGGAGITADLMVFAAHGLPGTSCITGLTVQSSLGVQATYPVDADVVGQTLRCLEEDGMLGGVKIGMLATESNTNKIIEYCTYIKAKDDILCPIVLDPVIRSSSGRELIDADGLRTMREQLLPVVDWITPNLDELAALSGKAIDRREDISNACRALKQAVDSKRLYGRLGIIATGGHHDPPDDFVLTPDGEERWIPGVRLETKATHGTGCAFSSAFLCHLVLGDGGIEAATTAKAYVVGAMASASQGEVASRRMNHLWQIPKAFDAGTGRRTSDNVNTGPRSD